jgi:Carboxypeptidase regulatory-like domain/TonB dependent receptor
MPRRYLPYCLALCLAQALFGQEFRATITGRITDAQSSAVPGAKVIATLLATGAKSETTTGTDGLYTIPFLTPGAYRVEAEAQGFKRYVRENFEAATGERAGLDIQLEVGAVTDTVNVSAESSLLETTTATMGQVIGSSQVENMPLNGRTPLVLAQLAMGVVPNSDPKFNRPFDNAGPSGFSMGGAPSQSNELLIDGAPDTTGNLRVAYNPPVDAVDEVRVHAFESDAAYGHTGGGTANVVLKSGTNALHGSAYEFNQTSALAATPFFTNAAGLPNPVTRYNQWGLSAGGPLWIPKVFDGRNKVFWFFAWEDINDSFPEPLTTTVPTAAQRNGDLSALLDPVLAQKTKSDYRIYDPLTAVAQGGHVVRQPLPGNIIPASRINPIARNYLQFYPLPNQPGNLDGSSNYLANSVRKDTYNGELGRLDFNLSERHKLFWDFRHNDRIEDRNNRFQNIATGRDLGRINWGTTLDDVYTFSATTFMNVRLSWSRFREYTISFGDGYSATQLGFPSYINAASPRVILPQLNFSQGFNQITSDTDGNTPFDIFQIFGDVVKISGNHSIKIGADLRELRESNIGYGNSQGTYTFNTNWTRAADNSGSAPLGQDWAAFMLGLPTSGGFDINAFRTDQSKYMALFVQDDWRVRPNLTINLGLRFEHEFPTSERFNRSVNGFDFTVANPIAAAAIAAYTANPIPQVPASQFKVPGGLTYASMSNPDIYHTDSHILSPRFGFAWTPYGAGGKTVIRGGTGVFVFPLGAAGVNQPGFSQTTSVVPTLDSFLTPHATLSNPFPDGIQQPTGSSLGLSTFLGKDVTFFNPHVLNAYSYRWQLGVQRELPGKMVVEVAYVGNHAVHLAAGSTPQNSGNRNLNYIPKQYLSTAPTRDQPLIDSLSALVANPFANLIPGVGLNGATVGRSTLLQPFPEFNRIFVQNSNGASSYFDSLNVRIEKRYAAGLSFLANYTYSKLIEKIRYLNDFDIAPEKRIASDDRPQRFVMSASYELPFGANKLVDFGHRWVNRVAGGWVVNGIYTWQLGAPLGAWGNVIYFGGDLHLDPRQVNGPAFDTTRFETNSQKQLADNARTFPTQFSNLRGDGANNIDLSLIKNTRLSERLNFQLRLESFNAFNRVEFSSPSLTATGSGFGKITAQSNLSRTVQIAGRLVW